MTNSDKTYDTLPQIFSALANPTRLQILEQLKNGSATVSEIAEPFSMSLPGITNHLNKLEKAGLISRSKDAQWRPTELDLGSLKKVDNWLGQYRKLWNQRLEKLDKYVEEVKGHDG